MNEVDAYEVLFEALDAPVNRLLEAGYEMQEIAQSLVDVVADLVEAVTPDE